MGSAFSKKDEFGKIQIKMDKINFTSGDQVDGHIELDLLKDFPAKSIYLIIRGVEHVKLA